MPPPAPSRRPFRFTREQYLELGQLGYFDGKRVELLCGEIVEMSPINWPHALCVNLVVAALNRAFPLGFWVASQQPIAIPGTKPASQPQPDAMVIAGSPRDYTDHPTTAALLVEVSDTTLSEDLSTKAELYATANVPEYWVLDIPNRQLHVYRDPQPLPTGLGATAYRAHLVLAPADTVQPLAAPRAVVRVSDLFQ
ncbi:Uma2 family endonuclease [Gemmata obscuriglobus]|uniref:Uma2 family endonuclease n=2 Tax=Gemmata obscuriglobus TaxID=114 RepID=A0A2Z3HHJ5_9BACT|nr:Uma2 family endonuclease [Gemmata obscuriglobus]